MKTKAFAWISVGLAIGACGTGGTSDSTGGGAGTSTSGTTTGGGGANTSGETTSQGTGASAGGGASGTTSSAGGGGSTSSTGGGGMSGGGGPGGGGSSCDEPGGAIPPLVLTEIASGLDRPLYVTSEPTDPSRLYVVEQAGVIRLVEGGVVQSTPFVDLDPLVANLYDGTDERGLLGLAFHPDYASNGRLFVYFSRTQDSGLTLIELARTPGDPGTASPTPVKTFFTITTGIQMNHNGGMLAFGPDGYLYVGVGDGGGSGDPSHYAQNIQQKLGKVLRIDVDAHPTAPAGNLVGGDPDIWDYGLRNPWRFSFDRCTGALYIGDVGQGTREEIDVEPAGTGQRNYGWSVLEGTMCFDAGQSPGCNSATLVPPSAEYDHAGGGCSVVGGYVYRGGAIAALRGTYLYTDYCSKEVRTLVWKNGLVLSEGDLTSNLDSTTALSAPVSFGEDASGEIYVVDVSGSVFRIEPQ